MKKCHATADELAGMAWWNNLTRPQRAEAINIAKADTISAAWEFHKAQTQPERPSPVVAVKSPTLI